MAEVQTSDESGEMTQQFIEFVMMQTQQAAFYLGQIPNPQTGASEVRLEVAKMFIDQLVMIRAKTRGNLSNDELAVLNNAVSSLQMGFVEASQQAKSGSKPAPEIAEEKAEPEAKTKEPAATEASAADNESKKKFTKSYGS